MSISRNDIINKAIYDCMRDLYSLVQPSVKWENFVEECKIYSEKLKEWELSDNHPEWENKSIIECIGPKPYEFYYLPTRVMKEICDSYIYAYKLDSQQELLDIIKILKDYCEEPIVDKYIEGELREDGTRWPGHRGYEHPDNLEKEINFIINKNFLADKFPLLSKKDCGKAQEISKELQNKFFEFLDMAGNFFHWNSDLDEFNMSIYLGASPSTNKEEVINNWKNYRDRSIEINESKYNNE